MSNSVTPDSTAEGPVSRTSDHRPEPGPALVEARQVSHTYAPRRRFAKEDPPLVLQDVNLAIAQGESVGLIGESGSGKSTLGRILIQLNRQSHGQVLFAGEDLTTLPERRLRELRPRMQMVFQNPYASVNRRFPISQVLTDPLRVNRVGDQRSHLERAGEVLELVGLNAAFLDRYPHELSGGQLQRVCVARALILSPSFIVADEPTAALDMSSAKQIVDLLARTRAELGLSLLFISHDLAVVSRVADRIAVMYQGCIVETGSARQILDEPAHPYTRALREAIPNPDPRARQRAHSRVVAVEREETNTAAGCRFAPRCPMKLRVCEQTTPSLSPLPDGRYAACHALTTAASTSS